jgi:hypothetical protein
MENCDHLPKKKKKNTLKDSKETYHVKMNYVEGFRVRKKEDIGKVLVCIVMKVVSNPMGFGLK